MDQKLILDNWNNKIFTLEKPEKIELSFDWGSNLRVMIDKEGALR